MDTKGDIFDLLQVIAVLLNIGHKASHMDTAEFPFTHDWSAYVQGGDGIDIKHFVEKVIFRLHETFDNPVQGKLGLRLQIYNITLYACINADIYL